MRLTASLLKHRLPVMHQAVGKRLQGANVAVLPVVVGFRAAAHSQSQPSLGCEEAQEVLCYHFLLGGERSLTNPVEGFAAG